MGRTSRPPQSLKNDTMGVESLNCPDRSGCVATQPRHFQRGGTGQPTLSSLFPDQPLPAWTEEGKSLLEEGNAGEQPAGDLCVGTAHRSARYRARLGFASAAPRAA